MRVIFKLINEYHHARNHIRECLAYLVTLLWLNKTIRDKRESRASLPVLCSLSSLWHR